MYCSVVFKPCWSEIRSRKAMRTGLCILICCCCCCCQVASVESNSVRPHRRQPTRLCRPWDSPGKNTEVDCHFLLQCTRVNSESEVAQSCPTQRPHGLQPTRLLRPWDFPGKSTGVGCHCLLQYLNLVTWKRRWGSQSMRKGENYLNYDLSISKYTLIHQWSCPTVTENSFFLNSSKTPNGVWSYINYDGLPQWLSTLQETWIQSLGSRRTPRGGKWQPTPVSLPEKSHGQRSLVGYSTVIRSWTWISN